MSWVALVKIVQCHVTGGPGSKSPSGVGVEGRMEGRNQTETGVVDNCVGLCRKGEQNMGWGPLRSIRPRGFVLTLHV